LPLAHSVAATVLTKKFSAIHSSCMYDVYHQHCANCLRSLVQELSDQTLSDNKAFYTYVDVKATGSVANLVSCVLSNLVLQTAHLVKTTFFLVFFDSLLRANLTLMCYDNFVVGDTSLFAETQQNNMPIAVLYKGINIFLPIYIHIQKFFFYS
jgi:hypothetical protein